MHQTESALFEQLARFAKRDHFVLLTHADLHPSDIGETTMVSFKTLAAAVLLFATAATPALAQGRALYIKDLRDSGYNPKDDFNPNRTSRLQGHRIEGREIAAPPWSFACTNDQGPQQCDEPMWVYGSPDYLAQFKNAF